MFESSFVPIITIQIQKLVSSSCSWDNCFRAIWVPQWKKYDIWQWSDLCILAWSNSWFWNLSFNNRWVLNIIRESFTLQKKLLQLFLHSLVNETSCDYLPAHSFFLGYEILSPSSGLVKLSVVCYKVPMGLIMITKYTIWHKLSEIVILWCNMFCSWSEFWALYNFDTFALVFPYCAVKCGLISLDWKEVCNLRHNIQEGLIYAASVVLRDTLDCSLRHQ